MSRAESKGRVPQLEQELGVSTQGSTETKSQEAEEHRNRKGRPDPWVFSLLVGQQPGVH